ncbi:MAG: GNAT family N-acetyltransferase [Lentisphaerae bacterium]|jgi:hypothetical protein|nr:GNAT family N-acetyltransferase [Lentisphaerota bacterium]MBT4819357.1 GNAT family N-acetyltransferase [Lentisphaerota bacterium]MBT5610626.1 GNAT family N-acetyltransferase [Lentisphaerota bacterium]MBT7057283.1 GNAT family N-acetyltransferase [Lentisphaerota bacterium]MBT7842013.1 GNAT family N-acetyltransferase [Lentisphaerota bacterium]
MDSKTTFREYRPETDSEQVRVLLNGVFTSAPFEVEDWNSWTATDFTAPVAEQNGTIIGAIPLKRRNYKVGQDGETVAWVEHRVGVSEASRAMGIGSAMQTCAKSFLEGRGDVLLVYRGGERSAGYHFYEKNGLYDTTYIRPIALASQEVAAPRSELDIAWRSADDFLRQEERWYAIFADCFADRAGYAVRSPGYLNGLASTGLWRRAMRCDFSYAVATRSGRPVGYAVVGERAGSTFLMDLAAEGRQADVAVALVGAAMEGRERLTAYTQDGTLVADAFTTLGAAPPSRGKGGCSIMVHILDPESTAGRVLHPVPALRGLELRYWTPERDGVLQSPQAPDRVITLELKEHMLSRLLMRRLDISAALAEERITLHGGCPEDTALLARAFAPAPWTTCRMDFL